MGPRDARKARPQGGGQLAGAGAEIDDNRTTLEAERAYQPVDRFLRIARATPVVLLGGMTEGGRERLILHCF
jgi:hypothetical protein